MSSEQPLVSVIVPFYNMEAWLTETLDSIAASRYPRFEVLMVDDGSTDGSAALAEAYARQDARFRLLRQPNGGVASARNHGIREARGEYILPVDADDRISPDYLSLAAQVLRTRPEVKVVSAEACFFGSRTGRWKLERFSLRRLARRNMIPCTSMFRRVDWQRTGGFCEDLVAREDWDFWLSVFEQGGEFVRLPQVCLEYRVREGSRRFTDRGRKRELYRQINQRHKAFLYRQLGGPLRYRRSWSRFLNFFARLRQSERWQVAAGYEWLEPFVCRLPETFDQSGALVQARRNVIRRINEGGYELVVKRFQQPLFVNRIVYGTLRHSKARRSFEYAQRLLRLGLGTPAPVAWYESRRWGLFADSYYVCLNSTCPCQLAQLLPGADDASRFDADTRRQILQDVARFTARLHGQGIRHLDYSAGNILFEHREGSTRIELIDLNRMAFGPVDQKTGCRNFERLNLEPEALAVMARAYAEARGMDAQACTADILAMRWSKHRPK